MEQYNGIDLKNAPSPALALCYYSTGVEFGKYNEESGFSFSDKHKESDLTQLHIFNDSEELRAVFSVSEQKFILAIIQKDIADNDSANYIDEYMYIFGEEYVKEARNITHLKDKGATKEIYLAIAKEDFDEGVSIGVRNYLKYDDSGMVKVSNFRLTGLFKGIGEKREELNNG